jgi:thiamine biosynthesis lipoprotein ApbE
MRALPSRRSALLRPLLAAAVAAVAAGPAAAVRLAGTAFEVAAEIEVRDLAPAEAEAAIAAAFTELDRAAADLRAIEAAAATGRPVALGPRARALVERTLGFCFWSEGVVGPLGGELYRQLGLRAPVAALPTPDALAAATAAAACERATLDSAASTVAVAEGSRVDFFPFELGWGADRAVELLRARGATNVEVVVGPVRRAAGGGPAGLGWRVALPPTPGLEEPLAPFYLRDRTLVVLAPTDRPLRIAGDPVVPYVDQRSGRTAGGIAQVMAVTELATDAQALAYAMFALGPREGMLRLGSLSPRPSVRWLLGTGAGPPVLTDYNWSAVPRH